VKINNLDPHPAVADSVGRPKARLQFFTLSFFSEAGFSDLCLPADASGKLHISPLY
jgi:hypothetical protein